MEWMEVVDVINGKTENFKNCIYLWRNKVNQKLYVGQAKDFRERTKQHKRTSFNKKQQYQYNIPLHCAIRKYGIENFEICILEKKLNDYDEMNEKEVYYIEKYDTLANNKKGYNVALGGRSGNKIAGKTPEEKREISEKQSESHKGEKNYMYGKHHSDEMKIKFSEAKKGKQLSEETKQKMSEAKKGKNSGENNHQSRKVICITNGEIFNYVKQAEEKYGVNDGNISSCCKGKYKSAGVIDGKPAVWMYLEDYEKLTQEEVDRIKNQEVPNGGRPKAVICITTGKIYESTMEAERQTGVRNSSISANCHGRYKSAGKDENGNKLIWKYLDEYLESLK